MGYPNHQDNLSASEDFYPTGSILFCDPSQVENWSQSVPSGEASIPSPPNSDCPSFCPDMNTSTWNQGQLPEDWSAVSDQEHSTMAQRSVQSWHSQGSPVTSQRLHSMDNSSWLNVPRSVDCGLSPVLSHESQNSNTLNTFSEPDSCALPPGLDLSFAENTWTPDVYPVPDVTPEASNYDFVTSYDQPGLSTGCSYISSSATFPGPQPSVFYPHGGQAADPRRTVSYPQATPMRPLLPRTDSGSFSNQSVETGTPVRPQLQATNSSQTIGSVVSSASGQSQEGPHFAGSSSRSAGFATASPRYARSIPRSHGPPYATPVSNVSCFTPESVPEDFSSFVHLDSEENTASAGAMRSGRQSKHVDVRNTDVANSYATGRSMPRSVPSNVSGSVNPVMSSPDPDGKTLYPGSSGLGGENDEGRHRSHQLYSEGPKADGLYHCPYKGKDPNCQHKPTKLKCNYDKFIDSHLKPFRCKVESCSKQEFSSTACLLRHEREAHGMHGHGDRPHLCFYPGCERGIPGNGFPRRYNLFDHMKRVHDHKEDAGASIDSPVLGSDTGSQKRTVGRKRKASNSPSVEPAAQRQKTMVFPSPPQLPPAVYHPSGYYPQLMYEPEPPRKDQHRQRVLYSQWNNQRELLSKQMDFVQSPDDEAHLQRLSQNIEELRRISTEARRG